MSIASAREWLIHSGSPSLIIASLILAAVVLCALLQPQVGRLQLRAHWAALGGAIAMILTGHVSFREVGQSLRFVGPPLTTLISLMSMTLIAEKVGFFVVFTRWLARVSRGDAKRLFTYLFFGGTLIGALFTNDAAVLMLTPLVCTLLAEISTKNWNDRSQLPYFFAVLYVANMVGLLVISNPINIVVARGFRISFLMYAKWMVLPALASIVSSYLALIYYFRHDLPARYEVSQRARTHVGQPRFRKLTAIVLVLTLIGFFTQGLTKLPLHIVAGTGAATLLLAYWRSEHGQLTPIVTGIAWDVVLFVSAILIVALGVRNAGLTAELGTHLLAIHHKSHALGLAATSGSAAGLSALMNNHPVAYTMALSIEDMHLSPGLNHSYVFAALIGGDLGPKMLPIGSLAALLWFRLLRNHGIEVSFREYIKLGVPVTILAIAAALGVLLLEIVIF